MERILIVSHCILNLASKVCFEDPSALDEELEERKRFLNLALTKDIQLIQMPCPEFMLYGSRRWGHVKQQFQHPHFLEQAREMFKPILMQIMEYSQYPEVYELLGIVSVEGSPSCGYKLTCEGNWYGEFGEDINHVQKVLGTLEMTNNPGVFMEIIIEELKSKNIAVPIITMPEANGLLEKI